MPPAVLRQGLKLPALCRIRRDIGQVLELGAGGGDRELHVAAQQLAHSHWRTRGQERVSLLHAQLDVRVVVEVETGQGPLHEVAGIQRQDGQIVPGPVAHPLGQGDLDVPLGPGAGLGQIHQFPVRRRRYRAPARSGATAGPGRCRRTGVQARAARPAGWSAARGRRPRRARIPRTTLQNRRRSRRGRWLRPGHRSVWHRQPRAGRRWPWAPPGRFAPSPCCRCRRPCTAPRRGRPAAGPRSRPRIFVRCPAAAPRRRTSR